MIKIQTKNDLALLEESNTSSLIKKHIINHYKFITNQCCCTDITDFGAFILLENQKEALEHKNFLYVPLASAMPEFTERIILKNENESIVLLHSCFVISDSYAISVFTDESILPKNIKEHLLHYQK